MNTLPAAPLPFPAYYDHRRGSYLLDTPHGWTQLAKEDLRMHMRRAGWVNTRVNGLMSPLDFELMRVQIDNKVDYAGSVAGHQKGLVTMGGSRVLVTQSFTPVTPARGQWQLVSEFVDRLLDRVNDTQKPIFYSWLQIYLRCLALGIFTPGQMIFFVGPRQCGKSFMQNLLTVLFGGRSANPWPYMSGATDFNSDLFCAEHLQIEDPPVNKIADRLDFSARIKQFTVNEIQPCHGKNRDITTLNPRWRMTGSINHEPYNIRAIPPIDDSTADKINIFKCAPDSVPFQSSDIEERNSFRKAIEAELPAFAWFLLNEWQIPVKLRSDRFGVTHYHHPEILAEINSQSPEFDLLCTLDEINIFGTSGCWTGTVKQLVQRLMVENDPEAQKLARNERMLALKLASLAMKYPQRVHYKKTNTVRLWIIYKTELAGD